MSIETLIQENTLTMQQLIAAINGMAKSMSAVTTIGSPAGDAAPAELKPGSPEQKAAAKAALAEAERIGKEKDAEKAKQEAARIAAEMEAKEEADLVGGAGDAVVYDYHKDVAPLLNNLLKSNKQALLDLFKKYGVKNGAGLQVAQYPAVIAELSAA